MKNDSNQIIRLTKPFVQNLTYSKSGNKRDIWWDSAVPNFGVRVYPSGKKAYVIEYRINRRKRLKTIGSADDFLMLNLNQARDRARKDLAGLLDGKDPLKLRDQDREANTFEELAIAYMERHSKLKKTTWKDDDNRMQGKLIPKFGKSPIYSLTHDDIARYHSELGKNTPYEANRVVRLLSNVFNKAISWGMVPKDFDNPAKGIDLFDEEKRDRFVTADELPRLIESIDQEKNPYIKYAFWLYLLTGVRRSELLGSKWEDIDFTAAELRLPKTKAKRKHYVPLNDASLEILKNLPRLADNPYVFPGAKIGSHLVNVSKPWSRIRNRAGLTDVRIHDLRRTVGSWLAQSGNSLHLIGHVLNHSNAATTQVYARFQQGNLKTALDLHGEQVLKVAGSSTNSKEDGNV